ncbi:MAG: hypothetical protein HQL44_15250 [Alphaproteobacteria bacterium]|nr:hypothetical protein [Alphaproteobacteria bacterium]
MSSHSHLSDSSSMAGLTIFSPMRPMAMFSRIAMTAGFEYLGAALSHLASTQRMMALLTSWSIPSLWRAETGSRYFASMRT